MRVRERGEGKGRKRGREIRREGINYFKSDKLRDVCALPGYDTVWGPVHSDCPNTYQNKNKIEIKI